VLAEIRRLAVERSVFRGQVISFGPELFGMTGASTPLNFLGRPDVRRDQVVLPDELLGEIEGQVLGIAAHAALLAAEADAAGADADVLRAGADADADAAGAADGSGPIRVSDGQLETALDQLLAGRSELTRVLLGGQAAATAAAAG
jgi:hypothetical protein